jgi:hypothetical protein
MSDIKTKTDYSMQASEYWQAMDTNTNKATVITYMSDSCSMVAQEISDNGEQRSYNAIVLTKNNDFFELLSGKVYRESIEMLIKAINNRTIERDYFRLYCDMLDKTISEEDFDKIIDDNESDYVVDESEIPSVGKLKLAFELSKHIKSVYNVNDLSSLFSFNPESINKLAIE